MQIHSLFSIPIIQLEFSKHLEYSFSDFPKKNKIPNGWECSVYSSWPNIRPDDEFIDYNVVESLKNDLKKEINYAFYNLKIPTKWYFSDFWYNYYYDNQGQEEHDHIPGVGYPLYYWSGIYFHTMNNTKVTNFSNPLPLYSTHQYPGCREGKISDSHFKYWTPNIKDGDIILFPPYLKHTVPPSGNSEKIRFTFSFNLSL